MSYSIAALTDDYYEGTNCLINKFNIQNEKQLAKLEAGITLAKTAELDTDELMVATIHSANGITDYLKGIFTNHINH